MIRDQLQDVSSLHDIFTWIEQHPHVLAQGLLDHLKGSPFDRRARTAFRKEIDNFKVSISVNMQRLFVSNTHGCPVGGIENFIRNPDKPMGYQGWGGWMTFSTSHPIPTFTSRIFLNTGIHTGSGGGSYHEWSGGIYIFEDDFPGIKQAYSDLELLGEISGKRHIMDEFKYQTTVNLHEDCA